MNRTAFICRSFSGRFSLDSLEAALSSFKQVTDINRLISSDAEIVSEDGRGRAAGQQKQIVRRAADGLFKQVVVTAVDVFVRSADEGAGFCVVKQV